MPTLFGLTLFVSATLLFLVQPMVGKMVLPLIGGTPAVWNTCMVFFQALLLLGYYYAHKTTATLPTRRQVAVHSAVLLGAVGILAVAAALSAEHSPVPIVKSLAPQGSDLPFFGVILMLAVAIGLPFFTVSTTAPLLQKWFSETGHSAARDPYFLYAASNFGSLLALVAYPFVVEPNLKLVNQAWLWAVGFVGLAFLIFACGRAVVFAPPARQPAPGVRRPATTADEPPPHWTTQLRWLLLAAVPSSLMLGITTDVTTDIISMPLIWIVPLALYLITFIVVFSTGREKLYWYLILLAPFFILLLVTTGSIKWASRFLIAVPILILLMKPGREKGHLYITLLTPVVVLLVVFIRMSHNVTDTISPSLPLMLALELGAFFLVTLMCHGELARTRPSAKYLTSFYLTMSVGGMLGGLFNALVAPLVFTFISEYPISLVAACLLLPRLTTLTDPHLATERWRFSVWDVALPLLFFAAARFLSAYYGEIVSKCKMVIQTTGIELGDNGDNTLATIVAFGVPTLGAYFLVDRPLRFGACVGAIWFGTFVTFMVNDRKRDPEYRNVYTRSFFGTLKVEPGRRYTRLVHGTTLHGMQRRDPYEDSVLRALLPMAADSPLSVITYGAVAHEHWESPGREPLTYYHRTGPVGHMFERFTERNRASASLNSDVACIGLGTGTLSAYGRPGQRMTFFEIDPTVRRLVEEPKYFTYIKEARKQGVVIEFLMGDARLTLEQAGDRKWAFMLVDAFSSDAIPAHLLTKQSLELYFNRLEPDGIVGVHISNRYLDLEPVVERIVRELGYVARVMKDTVSSQEEGYTGKLSSTWIAVARSGEALGALADADNPFWKPLESDPKVGLWTDDYTPIKSVLQGEWALFKD